MDARQQRGLEIAARSKIEQDHGAWVVPSQYGPGKYRVRLDGESPRCTCPDYELREQKCKHIFAVEYVQEREQHMDGSTTITETLRVTETVERKTYPQDWPAYNAAQVNERRHFHEFLDDLCQTIPQPEPKDVSKGGRPAIPLRDMIFSACLKVYSLMSARRFSGELEDAHENGFVRQLPHFNSVLNVFDKEETTPILKAMIEASALPLRTVETKFAVDSTGFSSIKYASWFDKKYGTMRKEARWVKAHFATGVRTNVVTAVTIEHQDAGDSPQFPGLIDKTAETFKIGEVSADKAYAGNPNFEAVERHGGEFYPAFKGNTTGGVGGSFEKAFHYFSFKRDEYLTHYHQRSNVESTVSMVKRKFGDSVRAKNETAQKNEVYAKFVCHNLCVLIAEMYALGIETIFERSASCTKTEAPAQLLRVSG